MTRTSSYDNQTTATTTGASTTWTFSHDPSPGPRSLLDRLALWYWTTFVLNIRGGNTRCLCRVGLGGLCDRLEMRACEPKRKRA
jgi:hypothetical protein